MNLHSAHSPVSLSYVAALRGMEPRRPGTAFAYALVNLHDPALLIGLAASNPEGQFYGVCADASQCDDAGAMATARQVDNVSFIKAGLPEILTRLAKGEAVLPPLHYLCCDAGEGLSDDNRVALFDLAGRALKPGGLFAYSYRAYADDQQALRFLVREAAPEMDAQQAGAFLLELKKLGAIYFANHPDQARLLDQAIVKNQPDGFFALFDEGKAQSLSFDTIVALRPRGLSYAGDAAIRDNYIDLTVAPAAQPIINACAESPLYEPLKDFALDRNMRRDIWCRLPAAASRDPAVLFGGFAYGLAVSKDQVPDTLAIHGRSLPLTGALYHKLIAMMALMPIGVGDVLNDTEGRLFKAEEIVGALQILVACGLALPMRGARQPGKLTSLTQPKLMGGFNRYLDQQHVTGARIHLASTVLGNTISVSPREALVLQALDRGGLAQSPAALLPELERLAQNPAQAAKVMETTAPTAEIARQMVEDAVSHSIIQWYAYGLLQAA